RSRCRPGVAKGRKFRTTWISYEALAAVHQYLDLDRAAAVDGSAWRPPQRQGEPLMVTDPDHEDRINPALRPWDGASASAIAEMPNGRDENKTPPVPDQVPQPMLAAALYVVNGLGPHAVHLAAELRGTATMRARAAAPGPGRRAPRKDPAAFLSPVLDRHHRDRDPLPELMPSLVRQRLRNGWEPGDPLLKVNFDALAREAGYWHFDSPWLPALRPLIEATLAQAGLAKPF